MYVSCIHHLEAGLFRVNIEELTLLEGLMGLVSGCHVTSKFSISMSSAQDRRLIAYEQGLQDSE